MNWMLLYMASAAAIGAFQIYDGLRLMQNAATSHSFLFFLFQSAWVMMTPSVEIFYVYRYRWPMAPMAHLQFVIVGWAILFCAGPERLLHAPWGMRVGLAEAVFGVFFLGINVFDFWTTLKPLSPAPARHA